MAFPQRRKRVAANLHEDLLTVFPCAVASCGFGRVPGHARGITHRRLTTGRSVVSPAPARQARNRQAWGHRTQRNRHSHHESAMLAYPPTDRRQAHHPPTTRACRTGLRNWCWTGANHEGRLWRRDAGECVSDLGPSEIQPFQEKPEGLRISQLNRPVETTPFPQPLEPGDLQHVRSGRKVGSFRPIVTAHGTAVVSLHG